MLKVNDLVTGFGRQAILKGVTFTLEQGEIACLLGINGAGKSVLLRCLSGLVPTWEGTVTLDGRAIQAAEPWDRLRFGLAHSPQGRQVFSDMTVKEHLLLASETLRQNAVERRDALDWVLDLFPGIGERLSQRAGLLSGGEQQMLSIARALISRPKVLLLDEPSQGLAPVVVDVVGDTIRRISTEVSVLMVEQNLALPQRIAHRTLVLDGGEIKVDGPAADVLARDSIRRLFLGTEA